MCEPGLQEAGPPCCEGTEGKLLLPEWEQRSEGKTELEHRMTRAAVARLPCRECVVRLTVGA